MKVGVVVYSETGNTLFVAQKIIERLNASGNQAVLERIKTIGKPNPADRSEVHYESLPVLEGYDAFVFGSPVHGFQVATPMAKFIPQAVHIKGKKAVGFVTEKFPFPWMGGDRSLSQLESLLKSGGALSCKAGIVNWSGGNRQELIQEVVDSAVRQLLV